MDDLLLFTQPKTFGFCKTRGLIKGTTQEFPQKVPTFQNRTAVYG